MPTEQVDLFKPPRVKVRCDRGEAPPVAFRGDVPPKEFMIVSRPTWDTTKGTYIVDDEAVESIMKAFADYGNDLLIDYDHLTMFSEQHGQKVPAQGWIPRLEARDDGIYAVDLKWTDAGAASLETREYRYHSAVFFYDKVTRQVLEIVMESLVNAPASKQQVPLAASNVTSGNDDNIPPSESEKDNKMPEQVLEMLKKEHDETKKQLEAAKQEIETSNKLLVDAMAAIECKDRAEFVATCKIEHDRAASVETLTSDLEAMKTEKVQAEKATLIEAASLGADKKGWLQEQSIEVVKTYLEKCGKEPEVSTTSQSASAVADPNTSEMEEWFVKSCEHNNIYDVDAQKKEWRSHLAWAKRHSDKAWAK